MSDTTRTGWRVANDVPALGGDVHVWRASVADHAPEEAALAALLDLEERAHAARFHFAVDRTRYVVAHAMLRTLLSAYAQVAPDALAFDRGPFGKPFLRVADGVPPVMFNMSHSADTVVVAVGGRRTVGVDVEQWVSDIEADSLAREFFSPAERVTLAEVLPAARVRAFFTVWSRKEAYIKATGFGVSRGLDHFDVGLADDAATIIDRLEGDAASRWFARDLGFESGLSGAVVVDGDGWALQRLIWTRRGQ